MSFPPSARIRVARETTRSCFSAADKSVRDITVLWKIKRNDIIFKNIVSTGALMGKSRRDGVQRKRRRGRRGFKKGDYGSPISKQ
jgi:hypothetical protein